MTRPRAAGRRGRDPRVRRQPGRRRRAGTPPSRGAGATGVDRTQDVEQRGARRRRRRWWRRHSARFTSAMALNCSSPAATRRPRACARATSLHVVEPLLGDVQPAQHVERRRLTPGVAQPLGTSSRASTASCSEAPRPPRGRRSCSRRGRGRHRLVVAEPRPRARRPRRSDRLRPRRGRRSTCSNMPRTTSRRARDRGRQVAARGRGAAPAIRRPSSMRPLIHAGTHSAHAMSAKSSSRPVVEEPGRARPARSRPRPSSSIAEHLRATVVGRGPVTPATDRRR